MTKCKWHTAIHCTETTRIQIACIWAARGTNKSAYQTTQGWLPVILHTNTHKPSLHTRLDNADCQSEYTHIYTSKSSYQTAQGWSRVRLHTHTHTHSWSLVRLQTHTHSHTNKSAYQITQGWSPIKLYTHPHTHKQVCLLDHTTLIAGKTTHTHAHEHTHKQVCLTDHTSKADRQSHYTSTRARKQVCSLSSFHTTFFTVSLH